MAGSMKLFQRVQKCHQIIGIYPSEQMQKKYPINWAKMAVLIGSAELVLTMTAFLVFEAKSMFEVAIAFYMIIATISSIFIYCGFIGQSQNTMNFIENCAEFIEKRVHSAVAYKEVIEKIELFNKLLCLAVYISCVLIFVLACPISFVKYYIFGMEDDSFYLFVPTWFPFDWKTPFGYLVAWLAQCIGVTTLAMVLIQFLNLMFGSSWLFILFAKDIAQDVVVFNTIAETTKNENRTGLTKRFCDMLQIYSDAKECVKRFNEVIEYSLLAFFSWNMLALTCMLVILQFELLADDLNVIETIFVIMGLFWLICIIFMVCEPGERMTSQFVVFSDEVSRCDWYLLSIEMQQMYVLFLSDIQNPMKMLSYGHITCERETFKDIVRTAFSYFLTLRRFSK